MAIRLTCYVLVLICGWTASQALGEVDKAKDPRVKETLEQWKAYERQTLNSEGTAIFTTKWVAPSKIADRPPSRQEAQYKYSGGNGLVLRVFPGDRRDVGHVANADYAFSLYRPKKTPQWLLWTFSKDDKRLRESADDGLSTARYCLSVQGHPLTSLVGDPDFHIDSIEEDAAKRLRRITFHCGKISSGNQDWWVKSGTLDVSIDGYRLPRKHTLACEMDGERYTITHEFEYTRDDVPILITALMKSSAGVETTAEFKDVKFGDYPVEQFRLEAFGLKPPPPKND